MLKKIVLTGLGACFTFNAIAGDLIYDEASEIIWSPIITLSGGPSWARPGQDQYLYPLELPHFNYYTYDSPTQTLANAEIFFGLQRIVYPGLTGQLGLGVAGVSDIKITGSVNVDGVPNAFIYSYKMNQVRVDLKGKLIGDFFQPVQPYISASLGAGFNNDRDFQSISNFPLIMQSPVFVANTTIAFPYTVGAGLQKMLNRNWQVGIGYEWADLGKSFLNGDGNTLVKGPRLTHLYTNELLLSVSYLCA